jgi:hypothetical protein
MNYVRFLVLLEIQSQLITVPSRSVIKIVLLKFRVNAFALSLIKLPD